MRHGRKSRSLRVDGYKRHILKDIDSGLLKIFCKAYPVRRGDKFEKTAFVLDWGVEVL
jgi:phage terminase small subunit